MKLHEVFKPVIKFPKIKGPQRGSTFRAVTLIAQGHTHQFQIRFDQNGKITGGKTLADETGHVHQIKKMGQTESASGGGFKSHSHGLPIPSGGRVLGKGSGGRVPPGGPGSMTGGGTGGGGMTGTGAGTGTPGTGDPGGNGGM